MYLTCLASWQQRCTLSARYMGYWPSVRSGWLNIGHVICLRVYGLRRHPAILTEQAWSIKDLFCGFQGTFSCGTCMHFIWWEVHLVHSGCQSQCKIWFILPTHGAGHTITRTYWPHWHALWCPINLGGLLT